VGIGQACILKGNLVVVYEFKGYEKRNIIMTKCVDPNNHPFKI
jgi:hypothetical protein